MQHLQNKKYFYSERIFRKPKEKKMSSCKLKVQRAKKIFFCFFRATPATHGDAQARSRIRAVATGLHHSHSNTRSSCIWDLNQQLKATLDPLTH